jgi:hypothetical protein
MDYGVYNPDGGYAFGEFAGDSPEEAVAGMLRGRGYEVELDADAGEVLVGDPIAAGYYETVQEKASRSRTVHVTYAGF